MSTADSSSLPGAGPPATKSAQPFSQALLREQTADRGLLLHVGLIAGALVFLYASVFKELWNLWMSREDFSHGFLVPLISLYVITTKWRDMRTLPIRPVPAVGLSLVLLSLAGLFVGVAGGIITLSSVSFIGVLMGLALMLFGQAYLRALGLPLGYLLFMTPVLDVIVNPLHHPLQLLAARVVSGLFRFAGVPTYLDGTFIHFPNGILEVALQCSGASFLISLLAMGLPLAGIALREWRTRVALIIGALVISVLANWLRVALIGMIGYLTGWGPEVHGPLHILQGMLVYWVGLGALFAGAWILARAERTPVKPAPSPAAHSMRERGHWDGEKWRRISWVALAALTIATVYLYWYERGPVEARQPFASFPAVVGGWVADESRTGAPLLKIEGADQELMRTFRKPDGSAVHLHIAYFDFQRQGRELVNYRTASLHKATREIIIKYDDKNLWVNTGLWEENRARTPILFWYALEGRAVSGYYEAKIATIAQALAHRGSNGALVLISGGSDDESLTRVTDHLEAFASDLVPILGTYLP